MAKQDDRRLERWSRLDVLGALLFIVTVTVIGWRLYQHRPHEGVAQPDRWALMSYRDVIYYPTHAVLDGINPYDSSKAHPSSYMNSYPVADHFPLYSPILLLLFSPLASLPVGASMAVFFTITIVAFVFFVRWTFFAIGQQPTPFGLFGVSALLMATQVGRGAINTGQVAVLLALATLGILILKDRNPKLSSLLYVLSLAKPTIGGPIALSMAGRGFRRSALAGLLAGGLVFVLGGLVVFAATHTLSLAGLESVIGSNLSHFHSDPVVVTSSNYARVDIAAVIEYLLNRQLPGPASVSLTLLIIGATVAALYRERAVECERQNALGAGEAGERSATFAASHSGAVIIVAMYICYYHNIYDLLLLFVPIMSLMFCKHSDLNSYGLGLRWFLAGLLLVPFVNIFWTEGFNVLASSLLRDVEGMGRLSTDLSRFAGAANGIALLVVWLIFLFVPVRLGPTQVTGLLGSTFVVRTDKLGA